MSKSTKDTSNRLNVLYILSALKEHSSFQHPLSITDITKHINKWLNDSVIDNDSFIDNTTVSRILDALYNDSRFGFCDVAMDFFGDPANLGFNLYCVMKNKDNTYETYKASEKGKGPTKYYYYESVFSVEELITLSSSVEAYNYLSEYDITGLVSKLSYIRPQSKVLKKPVFSDNEHIEYENSLVLPNIEEFTKIINNNQFAEIEYCNYNHEHKLVKRQGYPRIIRPLKLMWSNGYYYLLALLKPGFTPANLRIDRITEIKAIEPTQDMRNEYTTDVDLTVSAYRMKHPVMYGGKVQHITILYLDSPKNGMTNAVIDTFGRNTKIRHATQEEIQDHLSSVQTNDDETWMRVDFEATTGGTKLFALQYCRHCKVISPVELANSIQEHLESGLNFYKNP